MTAVLRLVLLGWYTVVGVAIVYLHIGNHPKVGHGRERALFVLLGVLALWTAGGLLLRQPIGRVGAVALSMYSIVDGIPSWRAFHPRQLSDAADVINLTFPVINVALLWLLLTDIGRHLFSR